MRLRPGDHFDRYVIGELLGAGGMGEVYRAEDTRLQRAVALKILRRGEATDAGERQGSTSTDGAARLLREARAAAAMDHPNAVAIFDVGEHDGVPFLAMEFIAGRALRAYVGDRRVPFERRVRWLVDAARALGAAHRRGLVHRDVKPENVMVREDGVVKVLDFGIARRAHGPVDPTGPTEAVALETLTAKGIVVGTPVYMAPEQMRGETLDGRADQFSWGVMAYELLTGTLPWSAQAPALQIVSQILSKEAEPPSRRNPEIAAAVEAVILRAVAKAPAERFGTMEEIVTLLEPHAGVSVQMAVPLSSARGSVLVNANTPPAMAGTPRAVPRAPAKDVVRATRRWLVAGAAASVVAVAAVATLVGARRGSPAPAADAAPASPVLAFTDSGSAPSADEGALGAYRAGMQGVRDASMDRARSDLERATTADPTFAAAHLRAALVSASFDTRARGHVQKAMQLRQSLSDHDRALLDAIEPWTRVPPDLGASSQRLTQWLSARPNDADSAYLLGVTRGHLGDLRGAIAAYEKAIASDPSFAAAWRQKARAEMALGDAGAANASYAACLRVSPAATWCIEDLGALDANEGKCEEVEQLARRLIALDPQSSRGYERLATAVVGRGQPVESARVALEQAWQRTAGAERAIAEAAGNAHLDELTGDFRAADEHLAAWERAVAASPDEGAHTAPFRERMLVAVETGRKEAAAKLADEYVRRRAAWTPDDFREDPSIGALAVAYAAGGVARDAMEARRSEWWARESERPVRMAQGEHDAGASAASRMAWVLAYARTSVSEADAAEALARLPPGGPPDDALARTAAIDDAIGRTYVLARRDDDAGPFLGRAAASCAALDEPIEQTWAKLHDAQLHEAHGEKDAACAGYGVVIARWGAAKPRSVSAEVARARARAIGCAR